MRRRTRKGFEDGNETWCRKAGVLSFEQVQLVQE
jgi:hypothetical protein